MEVKNMRLRYYCTKCKKNHFYDSKIGQKHQTVPSVVQEIYKQELQKLSEKRTEDEQIAPDFPYKDVPNNLKKGTV